MLLFEMNYTIYLLMLPYHHVLCLVLVSALFDQIKNQLQLCPRVGCHLLLRSQPSADSPLFLEVGLWHFAHHLSLVTSAKGRISTCLNRVMNTNI